MEPMGTTTCALFLIIFLSASPFSTQGNVQLAPALYIFGDSTVDGGNNVPDNKAFGIDLNNPSVPPRCTNGLTVADFFATFLGLPLAPPYKNMLEAGTSKSGVNYGSAGCGILPQTGVKTVGGTYCWSFDKQISYFNSTVFDNLTSSFTQEQLVHHLDKSVFLISFGINDFNINYLQPNNGTLKTLTPDVFAQFLLNELSARLRTLYLMGGRKFLVNNIWPLGCSPGYSSASCCNETINKLLFPYNDTLPSVLMKLQAELHGSFFSCSNDFLFLSDLKSNVTQYGISNTTAACLSNFWNGIPCQNRDEYLYFDGVHTTQAANNIFALNCFNGSICSPNMIQLLGA
ncbi:hypothetical protein RHSIM_Rhsim09G0121000 [Rhododendron simsii]|uniref:GDSL esterase/lipase n=1 Tax=Rhododendron simsii TaxID=118357 RepID=A0A834GIA5_RHOSS|nr:hypothetical protein RHSIM_Rhsim09G0121000 [Rhododendron simsii]